MEERMIFAFSIIFGALIFWYLLHTEDTRKKKKFLRNIPCPLGLTPAEYAEFLKFKSDCNGLYNGVIKGDHSGWSNLDQDANKSVYRFLDTHLDDERYKSCYVTVTRVFYQLMIDKDPSMAQSFAGHFHMTWKNKS